MNISSAENLHRTAKLELDEGRARTAAEAEQIVGGYVLQIDVGGGVTESRTRQAMLLTAINAARRAFLGGVRVRLRDDGPIGAMWAEGRGLANSVEYFGGTIVVSLDRRFPTLVIGDVADVPLGSIVLYATWQGWAGAVVEEPCSRLPESLELPLAGVLAAGLGVSEAFQHIRGFAPAGRRSLGHSLWRPDADWRSEAAHGDPCLYLPSRLWLLGLGHLGQAYAWALGLLPFADASAVELVLQDFDIVGEANESTGMLSDASSVGHRKSRIVSARLEAVGFRTAITERPFNSVTRRSGDEPRVVLAGVDDPETRKLLEGAGFDLIVDAGLGGRSDNYLDILIHSFPSGIEAATAWSARSASPEVSLIGRPAYVDLQQELRKATDLSDGEIECGVIEMAGRSVGAAFVGCVAATLALSEILRALCGGPRFEVLSLSLRSPRQVQAVRNTREDLPTNPGFVFARPERELALQAKGSV